MQNVPDLDNTRAAFEAWRAGRTHPTARIPDPLRQAAVALLDHYSFAEVCKALALRSTSLRKLQRELSVSTLEAAALPPAFIELSPLPVAHHQPQGPAPSCRIVLERPDGARLALSVPVLDWARLDALCHGFLRS